MVGPVGGSVGGVVVSGEVEVNDTGPLTTVSAVGSVGLVSVEGVVL